MLRTTGVADTQVVGVARLTLVGVIVAMAWVEAVHIIWLGKIRLFVCDVSLAYLADLEGYSFCFLCETAYDKPNVAWMGLPLDLLRALLLRPSGRHCNGDGRIAARCQLASGM